MAEQLEGQVAGDDDKNDEVQVLQRVSELAGSGDGGMLCLVPAADHQKSETDGEDQ